MSSYLYVLPTTGAISFADICLSVDERDGAPAYSYITEIAETTEARANLRAVLKENRRTDSEERDFLKVVKTVDEYLPRLWAILNCLEHGEIVLKTEPIFSWRTTLSSTLFHSSPRIALATLSTDLLFTSLTHAFALSNLSRAVVASLGTYETQRAILDAERKAKDERLGFAVTLLCRAAGVYEWVAKEGIGRWEKERERVAREGGGWCARPPDFSKEVVVALSKMALGDAQNLAIRKLLSKAAYDNTISPGPPLPKSHPSPALIAKLHLECTALYSSARSLAKTPEASASARAKLKVPLASNKAQSQQEELTEVVPELRHYLADEAALHSALAWKWLGVDAGENGGRDKAGIAVGFLQGAKKELEELKGGGLASGGSLMGGEREKEMRETRKDKVAKELESVGILLSGYKKLNDNVSFQPVPSSSDLQASIPAGRLAVTVKAYAPPTPAFGPGSVAYIQRQTEALELTALRDDEPSSTKNSGDAGGDGSRVQENSVGLPSGKSYAGAGSYF